MQRSINYMEFITIDCKLQKVAQGYRRTLSVVQLLEAYF